MIGEKKLIFKRSSLDNIFSEIRTRLEVTF